MHWTAEKLSQLATGYWSAQALVTAVSCGVLDHLPASTERACLAANLDLRTGGMLLEALHAMGLLELHPDGWTLAPTAEPLLRRDSPHSLAGALALNAAMYGLWARMPDLLRTGQPVVPPGGHLGADPERTKGFVLAMESRGRALLGPVAHALNLRDERTLLDVGSGAGTLGRLLVDLHPRLRVTLLDLPAVTDVAAGLSRAHPGSDRITHLAADYLKASLPGPFDLVVSCGALHQHDREQARRVVAQLAAAAKPRGRVVVVDLMAGTGLPGGFSELFGLNMALISPTARVHSVEDVRGYMADVGLTVLDDRPASPNSGTDAMYHIVEGAWA